MCRHGGSCGHECNNTSENEGAKVHFHLILLLERTAPGY
jgi:hypothetical protein